MNGQESPPARDSSWFEKLRARLRPSQHRTQAASAPDSQEEWPVNDRSPHRAQAASAPDSHNWPDNEWPNAEPRQLTESMDRQTHRFRSVTYFPQNDAFLITLLDGRAYQLFGASLSSDPTFDHHSVITGVRLDPAQNDHFTIQFASGATLQVSWERVLDKCEQTVHEDRGSYTPIHPPSSLYEAQHVRWLERQIETLQSALLDRSRWPVSVQPYLQAGIAPLVCPHCHHTVSMLPASPDTTNDTTTAEAGTRRPTPEKPAPEKPIQEKTQAGSRRRPDEVLEELESHVNALRRGGPKSTGTRTKTEEPTLKEAIKEAGEQVRDGDEEDFGRAMRSLAAAGTKVGLRKAKDKLVTSAAPALRRGLLNLLSDLLENDEEKDKPRGREKTRR